jgi:hypothetical protein
MTILNIAPLGVTTIPVSGVTATKLPMPTQTSVVPNLVLLVAETGSLRWNDVAAATPSVGVLLAPNLLPYEYTGNIAQISLVGVTGTTAVSLAFYRTEG